jgi:hypothetical protein
MCIRIYNYIPKMPIKTGKTVGMHWINIRAVVGQVKAVPLQALTLSLIAGGVAIHFASSVFNFILLKIKNNIIMIDNMLY